MKIKNLTIGEMIQYAMIFLLLAIMPVLVLCFNVKLPATLAPIHGSTVYDFFIYGKSRIVFFSVFVFTISYFVDFFSNLDDFMDIKKIIKSPLFIGSNLLIIFTFLSFLFSKYKDVVLFGAVERYESMFIGMGYIFIMLYIANFCKKKINVHLVLVAITFGAFFVGLIGVMQYIDFNTNLFPNTTVDPLKWDFIKNIYLINYPDLKDVLNFKFEQVYSTLYNPNYVGLYGAMYIPIGMASFFYYDKKSFMKWVSLVTSIFIFLSLIGSKSDAGIIAVFATLIFTLVLISIYNFKVLNNKKIMTVVTGVVIASFVITIIAFETIPSVNNIGKNFLNAVFGNSNGSDIYSVDNALYIKLDEVEQKIVIDGKKSISVYEGESKLLGEIIFSQEIENEEMSGVFSNGVNWNVKANNLLTLYEYKNHKFGLELIDGKIYVKNSKLENIDINQEIPSFGFKGMESFGTGRGFIWSRSLPIAFKSIIIGSGSDTFPLVFPQEDIRGKLLYIDNLYIHVDKAHSIYLQYWINTGFISLIGYLIILVSTIWFSVKTIFAIKQVKGENEDGEKIFYTDEERYMFIILIGLVAGLVGYSISGLTADQNVTVSPLYWAMLGICVSKWSKYSGNIK